MAGDAQSFSRETELLRHFYTLEAGNALNQLDSKIAEPLAAHVDTLRRANVLPPPGIDNWRAFESGAQGQLGAYNPAQAGTSTTTTPTTTGLEPGARIPAPSGERAGIGQMLGGTVAPLALASLLGAPETAGGSLVALPLLAGAAYAGGAGGEGLQGILERLTGALPSRAGTLQERMQAAGPEAGQAELGGQTLGVVGRGLGAGVRGLRAMTQTGREAAARTAQAGRELAGGKALQEAEALGPQVRSLAQRATETAKEGFATHQADINRFIPSEELVSTLRPVIQKGPIATVLRAGRDPDIARALLATAETDGERKIIQDALTAASTVAATRAPRTIAPAASTGIARAIGGRALGYAAGHALGGPWGGVAGIALEPVAEAVIRKAADRVLNSPLGTQFASVLAAGANVALRPLAQTARRIAAQP